jgi:hypothetical protein
MIEIYNTGDLTIQLGTDNPNQSLALSDTALLPPSTAIWTFGKADNVLPGDSIIVFCDANGVQNFCEPHPSFQISSDGSEPITLWGPVVNGSREIIDQVWLPPLPEDVSFWRYPDGWGRRPFPDQVKGRLVYNPPDRPRSSHQPRYPLHGNDVYAGNCCGQDNGPGGNLKPWVERSGYHPMPAAGEPVMFDARWRMIGHPDTAQHCRRRSSYSLNGGTSRPRP